MAYVECAILCDRSAHISLSRLQKAQVRNRPALRFESSFVMWPSQVKLQTQRVSSGPPHTHTGHLNLGPRQCYSACWPRWHAQKKANSGRLR
jgi:uncharacterized protein YlaI